MIKLAKFHLILLLVIGLFFASCQKNKQNKDWQIYKTPYFQIEYPNQFEFVKKGQHNEKGDKMLQQASFFLYANDSLEASEDGFQANINLLIQDLKGLSYDLDNFVEDSENQINGLIKNSAILESKTTKNFHRIKYKGTLDDRELYFYQHYQLNKDQAFILTFSSTKKNYEIYLPVVDSIFNSFHIK